MKTFERAAAGGFHIGVRKCISRLETILILGQMVVVITSGNLPSYG
jgi:hypothetical protein